MADGPRYKMLGNSFARPVITWIGRQIERAVAEGGQGG
jgi:DNA (cytosine-5)-methyltransferase 1